MRCPAHRSPGPKFHRCLYKQPISLHPEYAGGARPFASGGQRPECHPKKPPEQPLGGISPCQAQGKREGRHEKMQPNHGNTDRLLSSQSSSLCVSPACLLDSRLTLPLVACCLLSMPHPACRPAPQLRHPHGPGDRSSGAVKVPGCGFFLWCPQPRLKQPLCSGW